MIDEYTIEQLIERLVDRIEKANTIFLEGIGSSIKQLGKLTPTKALQLINILKYGGNYDDIIREISKYTNMNIQEIDSIFYNYAQKDQLFYKKFYEYRNIPFIPITENYALKTQTMALANIVKNEMYNYARTNVLGYSIKDINGVTRFMGLRETYNRVLDEALLNVGQGKETFNSAMSNIIKEIGGSGLKTLNYQSGRSMRLDSAIRMHLRGRLNELHNENQKIIGEEIQADGIEITVHGNPAIDHAEVQGRQFSNVEFDKLQNGEVAEDYKGRHYSLDHDNKNGYRPIGEMNCYHTIFTIVLGVSEPEYNDKELKQIKESNEKGFKFDEKHYTNYEGTQLQRKIETEVRKQKDTQILAKASGNDILVGETQKKITQLTNKYKELSNISGLPTKMERMKISGYRRKKVNKINNIEEIKYARKNNNIWHSTENLEEIIESNKIISPSLSVGKKINNKVKYGSQFIEFKPELLENVNNDTLLYNGDGGNKYLKKEQKFDNLMQMLKNNPKYYNELKFNNDLESVKYIKKVYIRQDEHQNIIELLKKHNIEYEIYYDYRIRGFKKKR